MAANDPNPKSLVWRYVIIMSSGGGSGKYDDDDLLRFVIAGLGNSLVNLNPKSRSTALLQAYGI